MAMDNQDLNPGDEYDWNEEFVNREIVRRRLWAMGILVLCALGALFVVAWLMLRPAAAHEWYTGKHDPSSGYQCCGGSDCAEIPQQMFDEGAISPTSDGFDIHLSVAQAQHFNKSSTQPISAHLTWSRVQPSEKSDAKGTGYSMCVWGGTVQCFFAPTNT